METLVVSRVAVMHASGQERMQTSMHDSGKESMHACMYDKEEVVEVCIKTSGKTTVSWQGHRKPPAGPRGGCSTGTVPQFELMSPRLSARGSQLAQRELGCFA